MLCQELAHGIEVLQGHISALKYLKGVVLLLRARTTVCFGVAGNRRNRSFVFFFFPEISRHCGNYDLERSFSNSSAFLRDLLLFFIGPSAFPTR